MLIHFAIGLCTWLIRYFVQFNFTLIKYKTYYFKLSAENEHTISSKIYLFHRSGGQLKSPLQFHRLIDYLHCLIHFEPRVCIIISNFLINPLHIPIPRESASEIRGSFVMLLSSLMWQKSVGARSFWERENGAITPWLTDIVTVLPTSARLIDEVR